MQATLKKDSDTDVFLWILQNFLEHLFRRTFVKVWFLNSYSKEHWLAAAFDSFSNFKRFINKLWIIKLLSIQCYIIHSIKTYEFLFYKRSSLENYTSNNTRQQDTTRVQHETIRRNTSATQDNMTQHECNTKKHDITRVQHDTAQARHETTRVQYDTTRVKRDPTRVRRKLGQQK